MLVSGWLQRRRQLFRLGAAGQALPGLPPRQVAPARGGQRSRRLAHLVAPMLCRRRTVRGDRAPKPLLRDQA